MQRLTITRAVYLLFFTVALLGCSDSSDDLTGLQPQVLPVIFVHGQSGSAQQFESQAMRFTSNGYPQSMLFSFEYSTATQENPIAALDALIDKVLAQSGEPEVYAIGHSRGTSVWTQYLDDPAFDGASKVARYVNIDGRSPEELPGGVPTIGIWGEWNSANSGFNRNPDGDSAQIGPFPEDNYYFPNKSHTEVATSAEAFAVMYEFLTGIEAQTTEVIAENDGASITIAGRTLLFPQNEGYAGTTVEVWEVAPATGARTAAQPVASFPIQVDGNFGPLQIQSGGYYEFAVRRPATDTFPRESTHHFFVEPYTRDNYFVRLLTSRPGESIAAFIPTSDDSTGVLVLRQREFWGDQGSMSDELYLDGLDLLTDAISPRLAVNLALFAFDDGLDMVTDLDKGSLPPFNSISFLTAADVFTPATPEGSGVVEVRLVTRGSGGKIINVPNRPSEINRNTVMFRDDTE